MSRCLLSYTNLERASQYSVEGAGSMPGWWRPIPQSKSPGLCQILSILGPLLVQFWCTLFLHCSTWEGRIPEWWDPYLHIKDRGQNYSHSVLLENSTVPVGMYYGCNNLTNETVYSEVNKSLIISDKAFNSVRLSLIHPALWQSEAQGLLPWWLFKIITG